MMSPARLRGSTPFGSLDHPVDPVRFALGAAATFVARVVDVDAKHFQAILRRAAAHKGTAFIEIYQNCPIFNDGAFIQLEDKKQRPTHALYVEHGNDTFHAIHVKAARAIAQCAREAGVERLVQVSGIGADTASPSLYVRKRAEGEQAVQTAFPGAVVVASHDRFFIDKVATRLLQFEGDGHVREVSGNWSMLQAEADGNS